MAQKERHNSTGKYYRWQHRLMLGIYMTSHFAYYPLFILSLLTFDYKWVLGIFSARLLVQSIVFFRSMKKLGEADLFPLFWLWDIWMFFYYLIFASSIWKKPRTQWT